jgi:pimeloyl-ACP methyl ester carboxylesterase
VAGASDEAYARAAARIAELAPRGRATLVENAGHAPQLQQPRPFARLLAGFLDGLEPAG